MTGLNCRGIGIKPICTFNLLFLKKNSNYAFIFFKFKSKLQVDIN